MAIHSYSSQKKYFDVTLLVIGILLLIITLSPEINSDGSLRFEVIQSIINGQNVPTIKFSNIQMYLSLPLAYLAQFLNLKPEETVAYFNLCCFIVFGLIIFNSIKNLYSFDAAAKFFLLLLGGSMFPHHLQLYFGEVLSSLSIVSGLILINNKYLSPVFISIGVANTPVLIIPLCAFMVISVKKHPILILGLVLSAFVVVGEMYFKYGSVFGSSYLSVAEKGFKTVMPYSGLPGFSYPILFGTLSILFSFGKGLFFFIPSLLLLFRLECLKSLMAPKEYRVGFWLFMLALIIVYSKWWAWYGGTFWGPRFFLVLVFPATLALAVAISPTNLQSSSINFKISLLFIILISTWVGINGVVFSQNDMDTCWRNEYELEMLCWYTPEFSALWRPFVTFDFSELITFIIKDERALFAIWQLVVGAYLFVHISFYALKEYFSVTSYDRK